MVMMDLRDVLRDILGSYRVQFLLLRQQCTAPEASALDFLFRDRLYEGFDYVQFASGIMALVPEDNVIDYKDDFGLHYLAFQGRDTETGAFDPPEPFATIAQWDDWQKAELRRVKEENPGLLFSDGDMSLCRIELSHREEPLGRGELQQYADRLCCAGHDFPLAEIRNMAMVQDNLLLFTCGDSYYQIRSENDANLRKYLELWKEK